MSSAARRWVLFMTAIVAVACRDHVQAGDSAQAREALNLEGAWEVALHLARPAVLIPADTSKPRDIRGRFVFLRNHSLRDRYPTIGIPGYYGAYDIDFAPFGLTPSVGDEVPTVIAALSAGDSVIIALNPTNAEMTVVLRGSMIGDSVVGTWTVLSRRLGGGGSYRMRRLSSPMSRDGPLYRPSQ